MTERKITPAQEAIIDWLIEGARPATLPQEVLQGLCSQLVAAGLAIDRCAVFVGTLHPNIMGRRFLWNLGEEVEVNEAGHQVLKGDSYLKSPVLEVSKSGRAIRCRLEADDGPSDFNTIDDLRAEGFTDYVIYPLDFLNGTNHAVSWATKRPDGFADGDLLMLDRVRAPLARIAEIYALRRTTGNLLDTYVGHHTGQLILDGKILRGDIDRIHAAILMADLRGFTALSDRRSAAEVVDLLNAYFDCLVPAIESHDGEVLKFMGDGLLAIFPIDDDRTPVCDAALDAALIGYDQLCRRDGEPLRCGIALHLGEVLYGNIGSASRLDFTTIGPAVNLTARLEPLTRELGRAIVTSAAFASQCSSEMECLGSFAVRGFASEADVFAPRIGDRP